MAGYSNNYGSGYAGGSGGNPPEYQDKPNADSLNGTYGTNTPGAKQNQQQQQQQGGNRPQPPADPYSAFHEASKSWWNHKALPPANPVAGTSPATGGGDTNSALASASAPAPMPPSDAAPVSVQPVRPFTSPLASTLRGNATAPAPISETGMNPTATAALPANGDMSSTATGDMSSTADGTAPPLAVAPPLPVTPDHPLHPDFLKNTLASRSDGSGNLPNDDTARGPNDKPEVYSADNPPPKPPNTEDPVVAAGWYRKFAYLNPAFANITADDVTNQRMLAVSGKFAAMGHPEWQDIGTWVAAGRPGGNYKDVAGDGTGGTSGPGGTGPTTPAPLFTDQQIADHYKTGKPFTPDMQAILDQRNPRPAQGTEDPNVAAAWYRGFAFIDPSFASITESDVTNQRMLAASGKFASMGHPEWNDIGRWVAAGKPGGNYQDGTGNGNGNGNSNGNGNGNGDGTGGVQQPTGSGTGVGSPPPPVAPPVTPPAAPPPATPPVTPPGATPPPPLNHDDALSRTQHLYDPLFKQQRDDLARTLRAQGALDGSGDSGGFAESFGRSEARLSADQGAQLAGLTEAEQNRNQAMTIAVMNDATQRYGIKTNDDLQRWLNDPKNDTLQKYGIDKNLLMEKYKAELGLQGSQMIASASFSGAALQAATSKAIAEGNNATQLGLGTMQNNLGWGQLQGNIYNESENRRIQEIQMLINAGVTPAVAAQIAASFGPAAPAYKP